MNIEPENDIPVASVAQSPASRGWWLARPLVVVVAAVVLAWYLIAARPELPRSERTVIVPLVETIAVEPGPIRIQLHAQGVVTARQQIDLASEVAGRVIWVAPSFVTGGLVGKGEPLLRLDPIDYEVAVAEARANLASANLAFAEAKALVKQAAMEEARIQVAAAEARLHQAQADLLQTELAAPFNAVIDTRQVDLGQYVTAGQSVMKLLGTDVAEVRLPMVAADRIFIDDKRMAGDDRPAIVFTTRFGERQQHWPGQLIRIENRVDEQTRVFYLVGEVSEPYRSELYGMPLSVGLFVEAEIEGVELPYATRLPESVLHEQQYVYLAVDDQLVKRPVHVTRREQDSVIIDDGLQAGDQVVLSRLDLMVDGLPVRTSSQQQTGTQ